MSGSEGIGGPCPRCHGNNCFIKSGSMGWYDCIACSDCFFAYGENADSMLNQTEGVVTGADVWDTIVSVLGVTSVEELSDTLNSEPSDTGVMNSPFNADSFSKSECYMCTVSDRVLERIIEYTNESSN
jgi:hypothetical protein